MSKKKMQIITAILYVLSCTFIFQSVLFRFVTDIDLVEEALWFYLATTFVIILSAKISD